MYCYVKLGFDEPVIFFMAMMTIYGGVVLYFRYWDKQVQEAVPGPGCGFEPSKLPQMGYHTGGELACFRRPKYCCTEYCLGFTWVSSCILEHLWFCFLIALSLQLVWWQGKWEVIDAGRSGWCSRQPAGLSICLWSLELFRWIYLFAYSLPLLVVYQWHLVCLRDLADCFCILCSLRRSWCCVDERQALWPAIASYSASAGGECYISTFACTWSGDWFRIM